MNLPQVTNCRDLDPDRRRRIEMLARQVETPHDRIVYGQPYRVEPTFCRGIIGDGAHLLVVTAVRNAPAYHAILIDSRWVKASTNPLSGCDIEADIDDADRRDLIAETLVDYCGDADSWHEENGEEHVTPAGLFARDMGFYYGVERLGPDGLLTDRSMDA